MDGIVEFLRMGGYGGFVWPCYGISFVVLIGMLWASLRELRRTESTLAALRDDDATERPGQ